MKGRRYKMVYNNVTKTVTDVAGLNIRGTLLDDGWFQHLKYDNGKPNMNAILILSEILYWYRPTIIKNEVTGEVLKYTKKFKADKLQKTYESLGNRFGLSKRQAKAACDFLKDMLLITVEFRTITLKNGLKLNNVMYVEPIVSNIRKISSMYTIKNNGPITSECNTLLHLNVRGGATECKTNTKTTTETTTEKEIYMGADVNNSQMESKEKELMVAETNPSLDVNNPPLVENELSEDNLSTLEIEALSLLEKMPSKVTVKNNYILEYLKVRTQYSNEELERCVIRYIKYKRLKKENRFHNPENFFRNGVYELFLDKNWDETLKETKKQVSKVENNRKRYSKKPSQEPKVTEEWDNQLKDLGW